MIPPLSFIGGDVLSTLWQLLLSSIVLVSALNTLIFSGFISLPIIGTVSLGTFLFNPFMFIIAFGLIIRKKLI